MSDKEIKRLLKLLAEKDNEIKKLKKRKPSKRVSKKQLELDRIEAIPERKVGLPTDVSTKKLQKHQIEFAENLIDGDIRGGMAIHGVGSGKTLTAVISAEMFLNKYPKSEVFVITPASLLAGFKEELYTYDPAIEKDKRYKFFTYDGYSNAVKRGNENANCKDAMLIIDEGQNLRTTIRRKETTTYDEDKDTFITKEKLSSGAKVFNILSECALKAKKVLILSATPLVNDPRDIENLMAMINGHMPLDANGVMFQKIFSSPKIAQRYFGCRLSFFEHDQKVRDEFFPKMSEVFVPIEMNAKTLREYNSVEKEIPPPKVRKELGIKPDAEKINSFYSGVRRASNGLGSYNSQKVSYIIDFIKSVIAKKPNKELGITQNMIDTHTDKSVIFTHFRNAGSDLLEKRLKDANIPYGVINGTVSKPNRAKIVKQYVRGDIKVILISKAGAEGLNLLETGYIFMMEPSWNNTEREQVKGRGVRFKSHINLPKEKQNVLVISTFLIKPKEKALFKGLLRGDEKSQKKLREISDTGLSIDLSMFIRSNKKQEFLDNALNRLRKTDPLEDCKQSKDFLSISSLFEVKRSSKIPPLTVWEKNFYKSVIKDDILDLPEKDDDTFNMAELKQKMVSLTRQVFGGQKDLVQLNNAFFTPPSIAQDLVKFSGVDATKNDVLFLEPTAGAGFIVFEALKANKKIYCNAVEKLKSLSKFLEDFPRTDVLKYNNFFDVPVGKKYRVILMNPPFHLKKGMALKRATFDVDFVLKAYEHLEEEGILVCLIGSAYEYRGKDPKRKADKRIYEPFRKLLEDNDHKIIKYEDGFTKKGGAKATIKEMETGTSMRMIKILKKSK
jgi:superfamily II DNA or RNA helicase